jgi:hypothetical protein
MGGGRRQLGAYQGRGQCWIFSHLCRGREPREGAIFTTFRVRAPLAWARTTHVHVFCLSCFFLLVYTVLLFCMHMCVSFCFGECGMRRYTNVLLFLCVSIFFCFCLCLMSMCGMCRFTSWNVAMSYECVLMYIVTFGRVFTIHRWWRHTCSKSLLVTFTTGSCA